jgi:hypothetical protein
MASNDPRYLPRQVRHLRAYPRHSSCQQRRDQRGALRPDIGTCKPLTCRNVPLTPANIGHLRAEAADIDDAPHARPLLPPLLRHQIEARRDDIEAFVTRHDEGDK